MSFVTTNFGLFFFVYFLYFAASIFFAFFIPGDVFIKRIKITIFQRVILGTIFGVVLWVWQGLIFGYLGQRQLSYLYLLIFFIYWITINKKIFKARNIKKIIFFRIDIFLFLLIFLGVFLQLSTIWFNGAYIKEGLFFCCGNTNDNIFHLALINQLIKQFPPNEPGMNGIIVQNYHYWGNLVVAEIIRVFGIPIIQAQAQYFSFLVSLLLGLTGIVFFQLLGLGKKFVYWLVFFLYFSGDLIFLTPLITKRKIDFGMSSLEDGSKFLANFPRAFSIIIFFAGLSLLVLWIKKRKIYTGILMSIVFSSLIGFKVYTGFFALTGLVFLNIYFILKKDFLKIPILIITLVLSLIIYIPVNKNAGGLYFTGLWVFENFIVQPRLGLLRLELARLIYLNHSNWIRVILYEVFYVIIYVISIFGIKVVGLFQNKRSLSAIPVEINIFLISGIVISTIIGLFFQQTSGGSNTFNFLVSIFVIGSIYSALACSYWIGKTKGLVKFLLILIIVSLSIPRIVNEEILNLNRILKKDGYVIYNNELQALKYIRENTEKDNLIFVDHRMMPLMVDAETPYVSFLVDRPMFLSGMDTELKGHGVDFSKRQMDAELILGTKSESILGNILLKNKIGYLLMSKTDDLNSTESAYFLNKVFQNDKIKILKVSEEKTKEKLGISR